MNIGQEAVIISGSSRASAFNARHTAMLMKDIEDMGLSYLKVKGEFEGISEESLLVIPSLYGDIDRLKSLAFDKYKQDNIVIIDTSQTAYLSSSKGKTEKLGRMREVPIWEALKNTAYTIVHAYTLTNKIYYIAN